MERQVQFCSGGLVLENNQFCFQFWFWKSDSILVQFWVSQSGTDINLWLALVQDLFSKTKLFKKIPVMVPVPELDPKSDPIPIQSLLP
jgi:hypothetical protein